MMPADIGQTDRLQWDLSDVDTKQTDDCLLDCLMVATRLFDRPCSAHSLVAGLALEDDRLNPESFLKAAERAGLTARIVKRPAKQLDGRIFPAVLLLENKRACLVVEMDPVRGLVHAVFPESGGGPQEVPLAEVTSRYTGYAIVVRPEYRQDESLAEIPPTTHRHWFWQVFFRNWRIYRDVLVASLMLNIFGLALPFFILNVYDRVVPNRAEETLWVLATGVAIIIFFEFLLRGLRAYFIDRAAKQTDVEISSSLFERVMGIKSEARPESVGSFATNLEEFGSLRDFITSTTITTLVDLPFATLFLFAIWWIGGPMVWVPIAAIPILLVFAFIAQMPTRKAVENSVKASAQKNATLVESISGSETIRALGAEGQMQQAWDQAVGYMAHWRARARSFSTSASDFALLVRNLAVVAAIIVGFYLISDGLLTMGGLIACIILSRRAMNPMARAANLTTRYFQARAALKTLNQIFALPVERPVGKAYLQKTNYQGSIEFREVSFRYPHDDREVLRNVSLKIDPGERVGVVGRIGSGKTTFGKLILSLYEPNAGTVLIDNVDIRQFDPAELRRQIGYVPQDVRLFNGSIRDNIALGARHVNDETIIRAAELAGVLEFVGQSSKGFYMDVGEGGCRLSGGQRQSIAIARALLLDPPILLFDEPTNAMDNRTEQQLISRLSPYLDGKTMVVITHKTSFLQLTERLIVLDRQMLVADGPKDKVLRRLEQGKIRAADIRS